MSWKTQVAAALDGRHPGLGHRVEVVSHVLIVLAALAMGVETLPGLPDWADDALGAFEVFVVAVFTVEYVLRLVTAERPLGYAKSFYGVIDLLSVAPFYLDLLLISIGVDLRVIRVMRVFRLLLLLKMTRYTVALDRLIAAWQVVREEVLIFSAASVIVLYICALVIYQFENPAQPHVFRSVFDAMWWAAVTLTTVGYGDIYPVTALGRLFTVLMLFVALGIIAIPTALVASALTTLRGKDGGEEGEKEKPDEEA